MDDYTIEACEKLYGAVGSIEKESADIDENQNMFENWLTDGKQGGALEMLARYNVA